MHSFNLVDLFIIVVIALSVIISLVRGFVREALSLAGWGLAIWVAINFAKPLSEYLQAYITQPLMRLGAAFAILFVVTLILAALINFLVSLFVKKTGLSGTDRMLGMIFGFGRGILLMSLLLLLGQLTPLPKQKVWQQSMLAPNFQPIEEWLMGFLPENIIAKFSTVQNSRSQTPLKTEV
jgi:membrane protein required for colicin V production